MLPDLILRGFVFDEHVLSDKWLVCSTLASHSYFTRSKAKLAMASREIENSLIDPDQDPREESSERNDEVLRLRQQLIDLHRA